MDSKISVENIYSTMGNGLKKYIEASVKDSHLAEDIFQNVFIKILQNIHTLKDTAKIHSWVYKIVRNTIIDNFRQQKDTLLLNESIVSKEDDTEIKINNEIIERAIKAIIDHLPPVYKEVLFLSEFEDISMKEIALKTSITLSAAKSRIKRGRKMLREKIKEFCIFELDKYGMIIDYKISKMAYLYLKNKKIL